MRNSLDYIFWIVIIISIAVFGYGLIKLISPHWTLEEWNKDQIKDIKNGINYYVGAFGALWGASIIYTFFKK